MARHPNITVRSENTPFSEYLQKYLTQAAAGTLPDLMYVQFAWAQQLIEQGSLIELDNYIAQATDFNLEDFTEPSLVSYRSNDKLYGIPYDEGPGILFYNKDIFDNAGVGYPDDTWTLDTLKEAAIKLTSGEGPNKIYGLADTPVPGTTMAPSYLYPFGAAFISEPEEDQCLINTPEAKQAMEWWMELRLQHNAVPSPGDVQTLSWPAFQHGRIAMFLEGTWATPPIHENANFNWDVAMWPKGPEGHATFSAGSCYAITKDSKNQDAAWIYLNEYISAPGQTFMWASTGRGSPSRISAWDAYLGSEFAPPNARVALESLNTIASHEIMDKPTGPRVTQRINPIWDLVVNKQLGVAEALDQICQEIDPILAENKA
jgi:multiple sugar transport system substrate-binding protein